LRVQFFCFSVQRVERSLNVCLLVGLPFLFLRSCLMSMLLSLLSFEIVYLCLAMLVILQFGDNTFTMTPSAHYSRIRIFWFITRAVISALYESSLLGIIQRRISTSCGYVVHPNGTVVLI